MNNQLHNQIKQLSDRELLEGIYQMLLVVMQEQLISDSKQLGINVIADSVFIEGLGDKNLVYRVKLDENSDQITNIKLKDGENVLPHSFATTVAFMGVSGVTDYIGLTITQLPSGQSVPTNEILKANPYLQDFSGNNRPLKLNNFLTGFD